MPQPPHEEPKSPRSVLQILGQKSDLAARVQLSDSDSEPGASPVVVPGSPTAKLVPQGRGNYQLLGEIARGGMGVILKGHDTDLGRDVAVKVLDGKFAKRPEVVQRFVEEAQIGGQLQHPGIVPVYELGLMADETPYFTMKLVKGHTLASLLQQRKEPSDNRGRLLAIFESVCQTVAYAHSKGVLHRDLKPANVMVGAFGEVQVVDWGLAKVLRRGGAPGVRSAADTVQTVIETVRSGAGSVGSDSMIGSVMGTPAYMAPEQAQGEVEQLDERADVFALGAILCELLTGKPPYLEIEGETIVSQAAHAKLKSARERIEACDGDPALVQLCLHCLMTSRDARPADAAAVAKAVHEFLASVEERATKAELAAAKASIQAAEARRAHRLTVALGGSIGLALLLLGGGFWWVNRENNKRAEQTRTLVDAAQAEAIELERAGKPADALVSARRAFELAQSGDADAALLERTGKFVARVEQNFHAAEEERRLVEKDEKLRSRLIDLRLKQIATAGVRQRLVELDAAFTQTFRDYDVDLEGDDLVPALKRFRERKITEDVALALDDWGSVRREVHGAKSEKAENLFLLAMDLDPDPLRTRMREAIAAKDMAALLELSQPENLAKLQPGSISVLAIALWSAVPADSAELLRMFEQALRLYPGDYVLQSTAGIFYIQSEHQEDGLACCMAALSLRPGDVAARMNMGIALAFNGRVVEAEASFRTCIALDASDAGGWYGQGMCRTRLGDYAGGLASLEQALKLQDDPDWPADLEAARFFNGVLTREEFESRVTISVKPDLLATYLYALLDHPNPKQRDPEFVLRILTERAAALPRAGWRPFVEAVAHLRTEDWANAVTALESGPSRSDLRLLSAMAYDFACSLIYSRGTRPHEARSCFERGMAEWNKRTAQDPAAWERSDAMRWRREAESALPK